MQLNYENSPHSSVLLHYKGIFNNILDFDVTSDKDSEVVT